MTGVELTSTLSGQRIFKKEVLEIFDEIPFGYGVEVGMTIDILKNNFKIKEDISKYDSLRDRKRLKRVYPQR